MMSDESMPIRDDGGADSMNFLRCPRFIESRGGNQEGWVNETVHNRGMLLVHVGLGPTCLTEEAYEIYKAEMESREWAARMKVRRLASGVVDVINHGMGDESG